MARPIPCPSFCIVRKRAVQQQVSSANFQIADVRQNHGALLIQRLTVCAGGEQSAADQLNISCRGSIGGLEFISRAGIANCPAVSVFGLLNSEPSDVWGARQGAAVPVIGGVMELRRSQAIIRSFF